MNYGSPPLPSYFAGFQTVRGCSVTDIHRIQDAGLVVPVDVVPPDALPDTTERGGTCETQPLRGFVHAVRLSVLWRYVNSFELLFDVRFELLQHLFLRALEAKLLFDYLVHVELVADFQPRSDLKTQRVFHR